MLGIPIGTWIGYRFGWHVTFGVIALVTVTAAAAIRLGRLSDPGAGAAIPSLTRRIAPLGRAPVWMALLPCLIMYIGNAQVFTYIAALLETRYSATDLPLLLGVYGLGGLAGSPLGGRLADRLGPIKPQFMGLTLLMLVHLAHPLRPRLDLDHLRGAVPRDPGQLGHVSRPTRPASCRSSRRTRLC